MLLPTAIVSTSVISLMISKFISDILIRCHCQIQVRHLTPPITRRAAPLIYMTIVVSAVGCIGLFGRHVALSKYPTAIEHTYPEQRPLMALQNLAL
jgi:hypothetical protein